jgi:hypothetical protein
MTERAAGQRRGPARPSAGTFRARLEITNRSGWVTREYRLFLRPGYVRLVYANGKVSYILRFDDESGVVACNCPGFEAEGSCKHRDAVVALFEGLAQRLGGASHPSTSRETASAA